MGQWSLSSLTFFVETLKEEVIMAHFNGSEYDNFAFDPGSVGSDWKSGTQSAFDLRPLASRIARWNIDYVGARDSDDYTRTSLGFAFKDTIENPRRQVGLGYGTDMGEYNYNPFVWGYAVAHRKMLDDSLFMMGMAHAGTNLAAYNDAGMSVDAPKKDVSDMKEVNASGMSAYKNYPSEGWSSFGKKFDKERAWAGNTWING